MEQFRIVWLLEGTNRRKVVGYGTGVQDAFTRLSPRDRQDITIHCVRVIQENPDEREYPV